MTLVRHENDNVSFPSQTWSSFPQMYPIERETAEIRHTTSSLCECTIHRRKEFVNHTVFVVNNYWHEINKIYEGYESSYQICISKLRLGLNISIKRRPIQTET